MLKFKFEATSIALIRPTVYWCTPASACQWWQCVISWHHWRTASEDSTVPKNVSCL